MSKPEVAPLKANLPWIESPFFEEELKQRNLSDELRQRAIEYNREGFLILRDAFDPDFLDQTVVELNALQNHFSYDEPRAGDLWTTNNGVRQIATNPKVLDLLNSLYGRDAVPFQTLNFKYGSRQKAHSDTIHFSSFPERYMCAVWVAMEDMDEENGPVTYYPKSHKLPIYSYQDMSEAFRPASDLPETFYSDAYQSFIQKLIEAHGFEEKQLTIKKGDALLWSANLLHGGSPIKNTDRTRWSQVTHYYFENCIYYTPQWSNPLCGEWFLREIRDIRTGKKYWGNYNGKELSKKAALDYRYFVSPKLSKGWNDVRFLSKKLYDRFFG